MKKRWLHHRREGGVWVALVDNGAQTLRVPCECKRRWYPWVDRIKELIGL